MSSSRSRFCSFELLCSRTQPTIVTTSVRTNAASSTPCCENQSVMKTILRRIRNEHQYSGRDAGRIHEPDFR